MRFCSQCGKQISASSKFCSYCGHVVELQDIFTPEPTEQAENPEVIREFSMEDASDSAYKLMEPGRVFCGYQVLRMLNKEPEGIKYIAEKDGKQYVLKLFFKYEFSNLDTIIGLQTRLKRLNKLDTAHTAKVVEVNQNHDPAYMVAEFISGDSLAQIKTKDPARVTEPFVRGIARQLIETAAAVRKQGLTLHQLTLSGIMVHAENKVTVLSSGIKYGEVDESEEVFNIGILLAQLLSQNALYKSIYSSERLKEQKFSLIPGVSMGLNKVLSDCLHRNALQRYATLDSILKSLIALPPIEEDEVFAKNDSPQVFTGIPEPEIPKPKDRIEWVFYLIVGIIVVAIVLFSTIALPRILKASAAGGKVSDYISQADDSTRFTPGNLPNRKNADDSKNKGDNPADSRIDPRRQSSSSNQDYTGSAKVKTKVKVPLPVSFIYIPDGSFGFNRLKDNPNDNVFQDGFYISKIELTQAEWNKYMMPADVSYIGDRLPIDNISWMNAIRYCNARSEKEGLESVYTIGGSAAKSISCNFSGSGYRLPTEAEWEMAAKAGHLTAYSGADDPSAVAWYRDNSGGRIRFGAGKQANAFGLFDMSGNVAEWCWDWYDSKYPTMLTTFINPKGPDLGTLKIIRGGSVRNGEGTNLGILYRDKGDPGRGYQYVGFRLVRHN